MRFTLNGRSVSVEAGPGESLLDLLRDRFGLRSLKDGCAPEGSCGACTVLVDGRAAVSCAQAAERVEGRDVVTVEGLREQAREQWADAFVTAGAAQCGYCSPGIVMKAEGLLRRDPDPGREEIARALVGNLCRCTGYARIVDAIADVAAARRSETTRPPRASPVRSGAGPPRHRAGGPSGRRGRACSAVRGSRPRARREGVRRGHDGAADAARGAALLGSPARDGATDRRLARRGPSGRRAGRHGARRARPTRPGAHHCRLAALRRRGRGDAVRW